LQDIIDNPNMTPKEIAKLIDRKYSITVGYKKAWRVREIAREQNL